MYMIKAEMLFSLKQNYLELPNTKDELNRTGVTVKHLLKCLSLVHPFSIREQLTISSNDQSGLQPKSLLFVYLKQKHFGRWSNLLFQERLNFEIQVFFVYYFISCLPFAAEKPGKNFQWDHGRDRDFRSIETRDKTVV